MESKTVPIIAEIKCVATGEIRESTHDGYIYPEYDPDEINTDIWTVGNFSCDCNRKILFDGKNNNTLNDDDCSSGNYLVNIKTLDGKYIYKEF